MKKKNIQKGAKKSLGKFTNKNKQEIKRSLLEDIKKNC